jgi:hypothetical protein
VPGRQGGLGELPAKAPAAAGEKDDLRHGSAPFAWHLTQHRFDNSRTVLR